MNVSQEFIFYRSYARWVDATMRRETYEESTDRYFTFMQGRFGDKVPAKVWKLCRSAVAEMGAMPSMRAFWGAGPALESNNIIGYNCCCLAFYDLQSVVELFYILMCGTGVGFSVESECIANMPAVAKWNGDGAGVHVVGDSREGWADALKVGLQAWFGGRDVEFDFSQVRPRGARLKTMGGRASGPEPLRKLLDFVRQVVSGAQGRQLTSVEWLDVGNMIGEVVVVGGVRRASEISFSDLQDEGMRHAKDWPFPERRRMSNNSAVYTEKPDLITFMKEWTALAASGSGERGIFNLKAAMKSSPRRSAEWGKLWATVGRRLRTNPCAEILLLALQMAGQFCNLSEVVVRADDTMASLIEKVKSAVWLGAMQSALTDFPYLRPGFKEVCERERLLGVSLTGQMDNPALMTAERLSDLKEVAIRECRKACKAIGINMSVAITTGKPSGTVSQLVDCASGCHARWGKWYIRRYRISATDPLYRMMRDQGVPFSPENGEGPGDVTEKRAQLVAKGRGPEEAAILIPDWDAAQVQTWVVEFPMKSPEGAITRYDVTAIQQLEWYLKVKQNWCEHNQSCTVYVRDDEWLKVGSWVYDHFDEINGISFLPFDGGEYKQPPYQDISEVEWAERVAAFPRVDYSRLSAYEVDDNTTGAQQLACSAGGCEVL